MQQRVSKMKAHMPQVNIQEGQRLMIIELRRYSKVRELLIGDETTRSLEQGIYWDMGLCN